MNETLFVLQGTTLYVMSTSGLPTSIGTIPGTEPVSMANNGLQLMIVNDAGDGYIATVTTVTKITDVDFPIASSVCFIDGYFIVGRALTKEFYISAINDGFTWDALDFASAEGDPDNIVTVIADHRELWLFGTRTTEVWSNTGDATFPFERVGGAYIVRGCAAKFSPAALDNSLFWLGDDGIVYRANGYTPVRVSTHAIEYRIGQVADRSAARGFGYSQEGHALYVITFPGEFSVAYDAATQQWHDRQTYGRGDWQNHFHAFAYDKHFVGSAYDGVVYELDLDTFTEGMLPFQRIMVMPSLWAEGQRFTMSRLQVDFESGVGLTVGQGDVPQAMLDWSDDGGRIYGTEHWADIGRIGEYTARAQWRRLGQARQRNYRVTVSDPVRVRVLGAYGEVEGGAV
jgi:hypothetical protein